MADIEVIDIDRLVDGFHDWVSEKVYHPLKDRIKTLEERAPVPGPQGDKGIDGLDGRDGQAGACGEKGLPGDHGKDGLDGKDGAPGEQGIQGERGGIGPQGEKGEEGIHGMPGLDGKDGLSGDRGEKGEKGYPGENGKDGKDGVAGKSVTVEEVRQMFEGEFSKWALDFERRAQDVLQKTIDRIPAPKDGVNGLHGKDGNDGLDGRNGADGLHGKDGAPGDNGKDGFGFDDLDVIQDGERGITLRFAHAEIVKDFSLKFPVLIDRGVYQQGGKYEKGDGVTYGGSFWIAQKDSPETKPGSGTDWRLAVKRGKDGKDGEV